MKKLRSYRIVSLILVALFCLPALAGSAQQLTVERDVFDTYGIEPILPLEGDIDVASIDYYYEEADDALPGLHGGVDMISAKGTSVMAVYSGEVYYVGWSSDYGNNVILRHSLASGIVFYSRYAHLDSYTVAVGSYVEQGSVIGYVGMTGQAYVAHLHFEIYTSESPDRYERSYTLKYLLSLGEEELSRMSFYYHPIEGEYNSQQRVTTLGSGSSCYPRCDLSCEHDHISRYAEYIKAFYERSPYSWNIRCYFDAQAEAALFSDSALRYYIYNSFDLDSDGHLSYYEVMSVTELDLRGLGVSSFDGLELFGNLTSILTDDTSAPDDTEQVYKLNVSYRIEGEYTNGAGYIGLWHHTDTVSKLWLRAGPATTYEKVGYLPPDVTFRVTDTSFCGTYTWGKTIYNGVEGWCALDPSWSAQLTSGYGTYTMDSEGYLIYTDTGDRVVDELDSTMSCSELFDGALIDFLTEGCFFGGWTYDGSGLAEDDMLLTEFIDGLDGQNMTVSLDCCIKYSNDLGDVDGNGDIDEQDLMLLLRYISGYRDSIIYPEAFDVNGDGKVNNRDLIAIRKLVN